jgi:hypothetical protein
MKSFESLMNLLTGKTRGNELALLLVLVLLILLLRELFLHQSRSKPVIYYIFLFFGVIVHEISHIIVCLLTFTKIKSVKLFSKDGGFVLHEKPRFIFISFLISIAPLAAGIGIIYFASQKAGFLNNDMTDLFSMKSIVILYFLSSIILAMLPSKQDIFNAFSAFIAISAGFIAYYFLSDTKVVFPIVNDLLLFCLLLLISINILIFVINRLWKSK